MVEPMVQNLVGNRDAECGHVGEIRKPQPAGFLHLAEDDVLLLAMNGAPGPNATLKRAPYALTQIRMTPDQLLENSHGPEARRCLQHRHDFGIENAGQGIRAPAAARLGLL